MLALLGLGGVLLMGGGKKQNSSSRLDQIRDEDRRLKEALKKSRIAKPNPFSVPRAPEPAPALSPPSSSEHDRDLDLDDDDEGE